LRRDAFKQHQNKIQNKNSGKISEKYKFNEIGPLHSNFPAKFQIPQYEALERFRPTGEKRPTHYLYHATQTIAEMRGYQGY